MIRPKPLREGDLVALIAPASCVDEARVAESARRIERLGFRVRVDDTCFAHDGYLAGDDAARAQAVNRAFADDSVSAVWCLRGGYGCMRLLDRLDWPMIAAHPKALIGYSDITALHLALHARCHLCTFLGPMPHGDALTGPTGEHVRRALMGEADRVLRNFDGAPLTCVREGVAEGELIGGNLCLVASMTGTPYDADVSGKLLFLEDVDERVYALDRYLTQLDLSGKLHRCAGVVFGRFSRCEKKGEDDFTVEEVIRRAAKRLRVPVVSHVQCGHLSEKLTLCLGRRYRLDAGKGSLTLVD